jgi:hypothetical protein
LQSETESLVNMVIPFHYQIEAKYVKLLRFSSFNIISFQYQ